MENEDKLKEAMIKMAEKPKAAKVLLKVLKEAVNEDKSDPETKTDLIESILEHDKLLQSYIEEDQPLSIDKLNALSINELSDLLDLRLTYLAHLIDKDMVN
jgi:hypothetical protein